VIAQKGGNRRHCEARGAEAIQGVNPVSWIASSRFALLAMTRGPLAPGACRYVKAMRDQQKTRIFVAELQQV
jgi:hypothetical protein